MNDSFPTIASVLSVHEFLQGRMWKSATAICACVSMCVYMCVCVCLYICVCVVCVCILCNCTICMCVCQCSFVILNIVCNEFF